MEQETIDVTAVPRRFSTAVIPGVQCSSYAMHTPE